MIYRTDKIIRDVRVAIDENQSGAALLEAGDRDTLALDEIIGSKIGESARRVLIVARPEYLDGGKPLGDSIFWVGEGRGWIPLPEDYLRLRILRMSDWERPVYETIMEGDSRYRQQYSRYRGLRGTPQKPVAALTHRQTGLALEIFSCRDETATIDQGLYIGEPRTDREGGIDIPERCYRGVVYECASQTLMTLGQIEFGRVMEELSKQEII